MSEKPAARVLSLLSASTEIVYRLGCGHLLVGRSHGCDDPPLATTLEVATAPKIDPSKGSQEIDNAVRVQVEAGGPVYHIHNTVVAASKPTIILTQEQCRICAVTEEDVQAACEGLPVDAQIVTIKPITLDDVMGDVASIAKALGVEARGRRLVGHLRGRIDSVAQLTRELVPATGGSRPKIVHLEWLAPLMGSGYWIAELAQAAGCELLHGTVGGHSPVLEGLTALAEADAIMIAPCGFSIERTRSELHSDALRRSVLQSPAWAALRAVRAGRVYVADGNLFFNRSSCGVADAAEIFAECVWESELCGLWGHHGRHWVRMAELDAFCAREGAQQQPATKRASADGERPGQGMGQSKAAKLCKAATPGAEAGGGAPETAASVHVSAQLQAMRAGDFARAFGLNSRANQARLGGATTFAAIVKSNGSFAALAASTADRCRLQENGAAGAAEGVTAEVHVLLDAAADTGADHGAPHLDHDLDFAFQLVSERSEGGEWSWKTDGVRVVC